MTSVQDEHPPLAPEELDEALPVKSMTIGAVCKALDQEFPNTSSISKIRYLEDQKLLSPRRTPGGYRLYSSGDVARLRTILRLQRDEFLPLRVIRQELASGRTEEDLAAPGGHGRRHGPAQAAPERDRAEHRRFVHARGRRRGDARRAAPGPPSSRSTASSRARTAPA